MNKFQYSINLIIAFSFLNISCAQDQRIWGTTDIPEDNAVMIEEFLPASTQSTEEQRISSLEQEVLSLKELLIKERQGFAQERMQLEQEFEIRIRMVQKEALDTAQLSLDIEIKKMQEQLERERKALQERIRLEQEAKSQSPNIVPLLLAFERKKMQEQLARGYNKALQEQVKLAQKPERKKSDKEKVLEILEPVNIRHIRR